MTYRERIQELIRDTWKVYDTAGGLRDFASTEEKEAYNNFRGSVNNAVQGLIKLDNALSKIRATTKC